MIVALFLAGSAVSPAAAEQPARCTVQQVHLPAGKIGPITTIERCKSVGNVAKQDVPPASAQPAVTASN